MHPRSDPSHNPGRDSTASEAIRKGFDELDRGEGVVFANPDELDAYLDARRAAKSKPSPL